MKIPLQILSGWKSSFLRLYPAEAMHAEAYPLLQRKASAKGKPDTDTQASLLADG